jgi:flagellar motor switch protein FliM
VSDILSQDEVDALLKGVDDGSVAVGEGSAQAGRGIHAIDLTSQERNLRGRYPGLDVIVDRLAKSLRGSMGGFLGHLPNVNVSGVELVKFCTFLDRLAPPLNLQLFRMAPLRGQGILVATPALVGALLQVSFGGRPGRQVAITDREFSAIELRLLERVAHRVLQDFQEAWQPVVPVEVSYQRSEPNPRFAAVAAAQDLTLLIEAQVEVEGVQDTMLRLCIPNASLDPIRQRLQATPGGDMGETPETTWGDRWRQLLSSAALEVSAELGTSTLRLGAVLALKVGDVVQLGTPREGPVLVRIEGRPRFQGVPGVSGGANAVRLTGRLQ